MTIEIFYIQVTLLVMGIFITMMPPPCDLLFPKEHRSILGIPIVLIGFSGYATMLITFLSKEIPYWIYGISVTAAGILTIFLIFKSIKHRLFCVTCVIMLIANITLFLLYIYTLIASSSR